MDFMSFINGLKGDILKSKLLQAGLQPHQLEGVDFNNMQQVNQLAEQIMPDLIRKNPMIANLIKNSSGMLGEKGKEVVETINKM